MAILNYDWFPIVVLVALGLLGWFFSGLLELSVKQYYLPHHGQRRRFHELLTSGSVSCPYCKNPITMEEAIVCCARCETLHHYECWNSSGTCAVFGCQGKIERLV